MAGQKKQRFFHPGLFWDVDIIFLDLETHAGFVIERVVTRGGMDDWKMLLEIYGKQKIRDTAVTLRSLDPKSLHYLSAYFSIDTKKFRCCT